MEIIQLTERIANLVNKSTPHYDEFMRKPSLYAGIYFLPERSEDKQAPHSEDELYFILQGKAHIDIDGISHEVNEGSAIFVAAGVQHRFHRIEQDLVVLVIFAPSEGTLQ